MFIRYWIFLSIALASTSVAATPIPVTIQKVSQQTVSSTLETVGQVESLQSPVVSAQISAQVADILVKVGDEVTPETVLATLDTQAYELQLKQAKAEVERLDAMVKLQSTQVSRYQKLLATKGIDKATFDKTVSEKQSLIAQRDYAKAQLQQASLTLSLGKITSPIHGVVDERLISIGDYMVPGKPMFKVIGNQQYRVRLPFSETHLGQIHIGQKVELFSAVAQATPLQAQIDYLRPRIDSASRSLDVFATFKKPVKNDQAWLPGTSINAKLTLFEAPQALVVPTQAVVARPAGAVVYVIQAVLPKKGWVKTSVKPTYEVVERPVTLGIVAENKVQILSGLRQQDWVAVEGAGFLSGGAVVDIKDVPDDFARLAAEGKKP